MDSLTEPEKEQFKLIRAGCRSQAHEKYVRPQPLPAEVATEIGEVRSAALDGSTESATVQRAWSECMAEEGFTVPNRESASQIVQSEAVEVQAFVQEFFDTNRAVSAPDDGSFDLLIEPVEDLEHTIASADVACSEMTNEAEVRRDLIWEAERAWIDENEDRIALLLSESE